MSCLAVHGPNCQQTALCCFKPLSFKAVNYTVMNKSWIFKFLSLGPRTFSLILFCNLFAFAIVNESSISKRLLFINAKVVYISFVPVLINLFTVSNRFKGKYLD